MRMPFSGSRALLALLLLGAACHKARTAPSDPLVIAVVNGEALSLKDFDRELSRDLRAPEGDGPPPTPDIVDKVRRELLEKRIVEMLMLQEARTLNVTVPNEERDRRMLRIQADYPGDGFAEALEEGQLTQAEYQQETVRRMILEKLLAEHVYPRVAVTEEEIRQEYDRDPARYSEPEEVRAEQIVVKTLEEAQKVLAQLRSGKHFEDMARKFSLSADSKVGGDLGYFPRGVMPPQFDEVAFRLGVGQLSEVVTTDYGFHIFKVLDKRPAKKHSFAEVREKAEAILLKQRRVQAEDAFKKSLRMRASVEINEAALASAKGTSGPPGSMAQEAKPK